MSVPHSELISAASLFLIGLSFCLNEALVIKVIGASTVLLGVLQLWRYVTITRTLESMDVYVTRTSRNAVIAVSRKTGLLVWEYQHGERICSVEKKVVRGRPVVAVATGSLLFHLDSKTGEPILWRSILL